MICRDCGGELQVLETRDAFLRGAQAIRRRRQCLACQRTVSTIEMERADLIASANAEAVDAVLGRMRELLGGAAPLDVDLTTRPAPLG